MGFLCFLKNIKSNTYQAKAHCRIKFCLFLYYNSLDIASLLIPNSLKLVLYLSPGIDVVTYWTFEKLREKLRASSQAPHMTFFGTTPSAILAPSLLRHDFPSSVFHFAQSGGMHVRRPHISPSAQPLPQHSQLKSFGTVKSKPWTSHSLSLSLSCYVMAIHRHLHRSVSSGDWTVRAKEKMEML